jgi:hypothetical protein
MVQEPTARPEQRIERREILVACGTRLAGLDNPAEPTVEEIPSLECDAPRLRPRRCDSFGYLGDQHYLAAGVSLFELRVGVANLLEWEGRRNRDLDLSGRDEFRNL